jgi:hypothetical protein
VSDFDHAAGFATQAAPEVVIARLTSNADEAFRFSDWYTNRAIPLPGGPRRTPDLVAILDALDAGDLALLLYEFQSEHDDTKLETTLVEVSLFRAYTRHGEEGKEKLRVFAGFVYLKGACPTPVLDMRCKGGPGTKHETFVWNVANDKAEEALDAVALDVKNWWGLLFWIALMTGAEREDIIRRWRDLVLANLTAQMQKNLLAVALEFAELAGRFLVWEQVLKRWSMGMGESIVGNRLRAQEKLENARAYLLRLLRGKYKGAVSADFPQTVEQQDDLGLLNHWYDLALEHDTWDAFVQALK